METCAGTTELTGFLPLIIDEILDRKGQRLPMKRWIIAGVLALALVGCSRYEPLEDGSNAAVGISRPETGQTVKVEEEAASSKKRLFPFPPILQEEL